MPRAYKTLTGTAYAMTLNPGSPAAEWSFERPAEPAADWALARQGPWIALVHIPLVDEPRYLFRTIAHRGNRQGWAEVRSTTVKNWWVAPAAFVGLVSLEPLQKSLSWAYPEAFGPEPLIPNLDPDPGFTANEFRRHLFWPADELICEYESKGGAPSCPC